MASVQHITSQTGQQQTTAWCVHASRQRLRRTIYKAKIKIDRPRFNNKLRGEINKHRALAPYLKIARVGRAVDAKDEKYE